MESTQANQGAAEAPRRASDQPVGQAPEQADGQPNGQDAGQAIAQAPERPVERPRNRGQFRPGQSGNPSGKRRPDSPEPRANGAATSQTGESQDVPKLLRAMRRVSRQARERDRGQLEKNLRTFLLDDPKGFFSKMVDMETRLAVEERRQAGDQAGPDAAEGSLLGLIDHLIAEWVGGRDPMTLARQSL